MEHLQSKFNTFLIPNILYKMGERKDIIVVGLQPWDIGIGSNCKNIAIEFAKKHRVLYVNSPIDTKTFLFGRNNPFIKKRLELLKSGNCLLQVDDNIWNLYPKSIINSINWIPGTRIFNYYNKINNRKISGDIKEAIKKISFHCSILFNDSDMFRSFYLSDILMPNISIYYSRDNLMTQKYFYKHGHIIEPALMKKSDYVFTNSEYLANYAKEFNPYSYNIGQGCDLGLFNCTSTREIPMDIKNIRGPIIGYIGALSSQRLNIDLLIEITSQMINCSFVFVGKEDSAFQNSILHKFKNVFFLGLKSEDVLPDYLSCFDVAINPQVINDMTQGNYPRKIDEYLAMGKPVVATDTITMRMFEGYAYLAKNAEEYIDYINIAILENNASLKEKRITFAHSHTWENCVNRIYKVIEDNM